MFQAVRDGLGGAWKRLREHGTLRLFLFEFTVVVLGVLTAQGVQNWSQERARRQQADAERIRLEEGAAGAVRAAAVWRAALPCLRTRVGDIMRAAGAGANLDAGQARRPKLIQAFYSSATPDTYTIITDMIGSRRAITLEDIQSRMAAMQGAQAAIRSQWELFRLLDPEFGVVSPADRAAARAAGAVVLSELRTIEFALDMIEQQAPLIDATISVPFDTEMNVLPVRSCAELWAKGTAYRNLDPGEAPRS